MRLPENICPFVEKYHRKVFRKICYSGLDILMTNQEYLCHSFKAFCNFGNLKKLIIFKTVIHIKAQQNLIQYIPVKSNYALMQHCCYFLYLL